MMWSRTLAVSCAVVMFANACKHDEERSRQSLMIKPQGLERFVGSVVTLPGGETAPIEFAKTGDSSWWSFVFDKLPAPLPTTAALEMPTACGSVKIPLKLTVKEQFTSNTTLVASYDPSAVPTTSYVWADAPMDAPLEIGKLQLKTAGNKAVLVEGLACAPQQEVKLGGVAIGTLDTKPPDTSPIEDTIFVTSHKDSCYALETKAYGSEAVGSTEPEILRGQQVYHLDHSIEYFLEKAPDSVEARGGHDEAYQTQLVTTPCS